MRRSLAVGWLILCGAAWAVAAGQGDAQKGKAPEFRLSAEEKQIIDLTNAERKKHDLPPLKVNLTLCKVARAHSINQAKQEKMAHQLDGKRFTDRLKDAKYRYLDAGENVAFRPDDLPPKAVLEGWMGSPKHRQNILDKAFTELGFGAAADKAGTTIYYTQLFGTPRKAGKED